MAEGEVALLKEDILNYEKALSDLTVCLDKISKEHVYLINFMLREFLEFKLASINLGNRSFALSDFEQNDMESLRKSLPSGDANLTGDEEKFYIRIQDIIDKNKDYKAELFSTEEILLLKNLLEKEGCSSQSAKLLDENSIPRFVYILSAVIDNHVKTINTIEKRLSQQCSVGEFIPLSNLGVRAFLAVLIINIITLGLINISKTGREYVSSFFFKLPNKDEQAKMNTLRVQVNAVKEGCDKIKRLLPAPK